MIFIIGGACQGKGEFARQLSGMEAKAFAENRADGRIDEPESALEKRFLTGFHGWIRRLLEEGRDPEEFVRQVVKAGPELVTMDEVGCGIVPVEPEQRIYREAVGHAGQTLAAHAGQVYRVMCGIPQRIKG